MYLPSAAAQHRRDENPRGVTNTSDKIRVFFLIKESLKFSSALKTSDFGTSGEEEAAIPPMSALEEASRGPRAKMLQSLNSLSKKGNKNKQKKTRKDP